MDLSGGVADTSLGSSQVSGRHEQEAANSTVTPPADPVSPRGHTTRRCWPWASFGFICALCILALLAWYRLWYACDCTGQPPVPAAFPRPHRSGTFGFVEEARDKLGALPIQLELRHPLNVQLQDLISFYEATLEPRAETLAHRFVNETIFHLAKAGDDPRAAIRAARLDATTADAVVQDHLSLVLHARLVYTEYLPPVAKERERLYEEWRNGRSRFSRADQDYENNHTSTKGGLKSIHHRLRSVEDQALQEVQKYGRFSGALRKIKNGLERSPQGYVPLQLHQHFAELLDSTPAYSRRSELIDYFSETRDHGLRCCRVRSAWSEWAAAILQWRDRVLGLTPEVVSSELTGT